MNHDDTVPKERELGNAKNDDGGVQKAGELNADTNRVLQDWQQIGKAAKL